MDGEDWAFLVDLPGIEPIVTDDVVNKHESTAKLAQDVQIASQLEEISGPMTKEACEQSTKHTCESGSEVHVSKHESDVKPILVEEGGQLDGPALVQNKEAEVQDDGLAPNILDLLLSESIPNEENGSDDPIKEKVQPKGLSSNEADFVLHGPTQTEAGFQQDGVNENKGEVQDDKRSPNNEVQQHSLLPSEFQDELEEFIQFEAENQLDGPMPNKEKVEPNVPSPKEVEVKWGGPFQVVVEGEMEEHVLDELELKPNDALCPNISRVQSDGLTRPEYEVEQDGLIPDDMKSQLDGPTPCEVEAKPDVPTNEVAIQASGLNPNEAEVGPNESKQLIKRPRPDEEKVQQDKPKRRRRPRPTNLPLGWEIIQAVRTGGRSKGIIDKTYISPSGRKFRSLKKAKEFINKQDEERNNELAIVVYNPQVLAAIAYAGAGAVANADVGAGADANADFGAGGGANAGAGAGAGANAGDGAGSSANVDAGDGGADADADVGASASAGVGASASANAGAGASVDACTGASAGTDAIASASTSVEEVDDQKKTI